MPEISLMTKAGFAASAVAGVVLLLLAWPWRHPSATRLNLGWTLGVGLGFYAGCAVLELWPAWPPQADRDRFLTLVVPAAVLVEIICAFVPGWWVWLPRILLAAAVTPTLLYDTTYLEDKAGQGTPDWPLPIAIRNLSGLGAALLAAWLLLDRLQARSSDKTVGAALSITSAAAAITVMFWGYLSGGQTGVPLAGALAGATVMSLLIPSPLSQPRFSGVGLVTLFGIIILGRFLGSLSDVHAVALFMAPLAAWIGESPRFVLRLIFVILPLAPLVAEVAKEIRKETAAAEEAPPQAEP